LCKITNVIHKFLNASKKSHHETLNHICVEAVHNLMAQHKELILVVLLGLIRSDTRGMSG